MSTAAAFESRNRRIARFALVAGFVVVVVFPILWVLLSSIKPRAQIFTAPPEFLPDQITFEHYVQILSDGQFIRYIVNSVIVATLTTFVSLLLAVLGGYGWGRFDFPGSRTTSIFVLVSQIFPVVVLIIPMFEILRQLSLLNSYPGLVLSYLIFTLPLTTWMLKGFFESIPDNLLRAARIDGLSEFQVFYEIALPLVKPGIAATGIYCFILSWQEFIFALTFMQDEQMQTLPVGLMGYIGQYDTSWGLLMAGSFVLVFPAAVIFMFIQKQFIQSLAAGGVKG